MFLLFALVLIYIIFGIIAAIATIAKDHQEIAKTFDDKSPIEFAILTLLFVLSWPFMLLAIQKDWSKVRSRSKFDDENP